MDEICYEPGDLIEEMRKMDKNKDTDIALDEDDLAGASPENVLKFAVATLATNIENQKNAFDQTINLEEHCHSSINIDKDRNKKPFIKLLIALCLCFIFMVGEIIGGLLANSISIQTDAAHMATDIVGFFFSILAIYISKKKPTRRMTFGFSRSEVIGALFSILIIWILTGVLVYLAVMRVVTMSFEIEPLPMVITASCGVVFNIIMFIVLDTDLCFTVNIIHRGHSRHLKHGQARKMEVKVIDTVNNADLNFNAANQTVNLDEIIKIEPSTKRRFSAKRVVDKTKKKDKKKEKKGKENINLRAAAIHVIGDFIQSVGVLIAAIIIYINPEYKLADPICTFTFSALVMGTTSFIVKDIFFVLMESAPHPKQLDYNSVVANLTNIDGVNDIHNLNIWCLTMDKLALMVHLVIDRNGETQRVLREANNILRTKYKIQITNIQVEYFSEGMKSCEYCKLPE